jgi:hypothetical protein
MNFATRVSSKREQVLGTTQLAKTDYLKTVKI